jgi:SAM-dependent methyltransferase
MKNQAEDLAQSLTEVCIQKSLVKAVFSSPRLSTSTITKVIVRPVEVRGRLVLQFTSQSDTQQFHKNWEVSEAAAELVRLAQSEYRNTHYSTDSHEYESRYSKKDKCFWKKTSIVPKSNSGQPVFIPAHNRTRQHLIPDGVPCPFLIQTGVMSNQGVVFASHARKFKQINRFLEFIQDIVEVLPTGRPIKIVDFGCGKSYLTFATQYLISTILGRECEIVGLDQRVDVVSTCAKIALELGLLNIRFEVGDIASYEPHSEVDLVVSLHACDTATDDALMKAIQWESRVILAVPCCQHELNSQLAATSFSPLTSFGITKERFASLATDSLRASLLAAVGYQTQILEFIETEHTPKNLLIRCVRSERAESRYIERSHREVLKMRAQLGVPPLTLERKLMESGKLSVVE